MDHRVPSKPSAPQFPDHALRAAVLRLERRLARLEQLIDEGIGSFLNAKFPYGDGKTDRWGRRRRG
jgi:hypothetical protein